MSFGLDSTGFHKMLLSDIDAQIEADLKIAFGDFINVLPQSVFGQIKGLFSAREASLWELAEAIYNSQYPDTAAGISLDNVNQLNALLRLKAQPTKVILKLLGTNGTVIAAGKQVSIIGSGAIFNLDSPVTLDGSNTQTVGATCTVTGATVASAGTITNIVTPVSGWIGVTNDLDGTIGRAIETDEAYRIRRRVETQISVSGPVEAIRQTLLRNVTGVLQAVVFQNTSPLVNLRGEPGNSYSAYVFGGSNLDIAEAIWASGPAGILPNGNILQNIIDSMGQTQPIRFSRPTQKNIYGAWHRTTNSNYPADGDQQLKNVAVAYINSLIMGQEVILSPQLIATAVNIPGIETLTLNIGLSPSPTGTINIPIGINEIARSDTSLWTVGA